MIDPELAARLENSVLVRNLCISLHFDDNTDIVNNIRTNLVDFVEI